MKTDEAERGYYSGFYSECDTGRSVERFPAGEGHDHAHILKRTFWLQGGKQTGGRVG